MSDLLKDPRYNESLAELEAAVRNHHAVLTEIGDEDNPGKESAMVVGWVLSIAVVGTDDEDEEFNEVLVEWPTSMNDFMARGIADFTRDFVRGETDMA